MPDYQKYCTPSLTETRHSLGDHEGRASDVYERIPAKLPGSPDGQGHCGTDIVTDVRQCGGTSGGTAPFIVTGLDFRCRHGPPGMRSREYPCGPLREKRENIFQILVSHHPVNYYERGICIIVQISVQLGEVVGKGGSIVSYVADDVRTGRESLSHLPWKPVRTAVCIIASAVSIPVMRSSGLSCPSTSREARTVRRFIS